MRFISLLITLICLAPASWAQPYPGSGSYYNQQPNNQPQKSPDLMILENEMFEARYKANPNEQSKAVYLKSSEDILPFVCKAFREKPEYISEQCQAHLDKIKEVDLKNKKAFCYENGFSSPDCGNLNQTVEQGEQLSPFEKLQKLLDQPAQRPQYTSSEMKDPTRQKVQSLNDQIFGAQLKYRDSNSPADRDAALRLYAAIFPLVCKFTGTGSYEPNFECKNYLGQALTLDPNFPPALCYRDGPGSPHCGKTGGSSGNPANTKNNQSQSGFTEF